VDGEKIARKATPYLQKVLLGIVPATVINAYLMAPAVRVVASGAKSVVRKRCTIDYRKHTTIIFACRCILLGHRCVKRNSAWRLFSATAELLLNFNFTVSLVDNSTVTHSMQKLQLYGLI